MPNCFQLLRGGVAVPLDKVDEEMCRHFGRPCDPERYFESWYDIIGRKLAMGERWDEIGATIAEHYAEFPILAQIASWLEANFETRSWYERKGYERKECQ